MEQPPPTDDSNIGHVLVSRASELTGKAQTCRNELFWLFGVWIGWADKTLPKLVYEAQDEQLREKARTRYVDELLKQRVRVEYHDYANGTTSVTVKWDGLWMEREVKDDGRSAARNAFVALLRKRIDTGLMEVPAWPLPDRPKTNPAVGGGDAAKLGYAAFQTQMPLVDWCGVAPRAAKKPKAPTDCPKTNPAVGGEDAAKLGYAAFQTQMPLVDWCGVAPRAAKKPKAPTDCPKTNPAVGGVAPRAATKPKAPANPAAAASSEAPTTLQAALAAADGSGASRATAAEDTGASVPREHTQGPASVALLFVLKDNEDMRNVDIWVAWLMHAPLKTYTIYVHAENPDSVRHPLFKASLVNPLFKAPLVNPQTPVELGCCSRQAAAPAASKPATLVLLKKALEEPRNQWFLVLNGMCLPMVHPKTLHRRMAARTPVSEFNLHAGAVQAAMLKILKVVPDVPLLVREAIESESLRACSQTGTLLVRTDAELLAGARDADVREWQQALSSRSMQEALYSVHGTKYFAPALVHPPDEIGQFLRVGDEDAALQASMHLDPDELFLHALLCRLCAQHGSARPASPSGAGGSQRTHKLVHRRCCLKQTDCECCFSRRLRPAEYVMLCRDFVEECVKEGCAFAQNMQTVVGVTVGDMQALWSLDADLERYVGMVRLLAERLMSKHAWQKPLPAAVPGDVAVDADGGAVPEDGTYKLSRHDVWRDVEVRNSKGGSAVCLKLRQHVAGQRFRVQVSPRQRDQDLPEIDFARLDFRILTRQDPAAPSAALGACQDAAAAVSAPAPVPRAVPVDFRKDFDVDEFRQYAEQMVDGAIKTTAVYRLYDLFQLIHGANALVEHCERSSTPEDNCALGFSVLEVKQPAFNQEIRRIVATEKLWHGCNGTRELKKPTWVVYELLRQIGVRPQKHCRGPKEHDPDPKDFVYATTYYFSRDLLLRNKHRLEVLWHVVCTCCAVCLHRQALTCCVVRWMELQKATTASAARKRSPQGCRYIW